MKRPLLMAAVAATAAFLLIGGTGTFAALGDAQAGVPVEIRSGTLTATAVAGTPAYTVTGSLPTGVTVRPGYTGLVPGYNTYTQTWTVTSTASARVPARVTATIATTGTPSASYVTLSPYVVARATLSGNGTPSTLTATATGVSGTVTPSPTIIRSGQSVTLTVTVTVPATSGTTDLVRTLLPARNTTATTTSPLLEIVPTFTLSQVPQAAAP